MDENQKPDGPELKSEKPQTTKAEDSRSLRRNRWGLTDREEAFCLLYVEDGDAEKAYLRAGYDRPKKGYLSMKVKMMLDRPKVRDRLAMLALAKGRGKSVSKEVFLDMVMKNYELAQENGDFAAANKSLEIMGKSMGYVIDQRQTLQVTASMNKPIAVEDQAERIQRLAELAGMRLELPAPRGEENVIDGEFSDDTDS